MSQRTLEAGSAVGPYLIDTVIGLGQCGITYQAHDGQSGIACVVKEFFPRAQATRGNDQSLVPLPDCNDDLQLGVQRFLHDAHALARITHPNIVRILGAIEANNTAYMVMAHETGDKLAEALKRGFSPTPEALLSISLSLIDAVQTLHRDGLIHRDVKENNVHLRADATPVLLDFGAARVGLLRRRLALGNAVRGDADYDNLDGNAGPWTDMHALAAMLFRLASSLGKTGGGRTCPPEIAEAIRFGIAAQQNNVASLVGQWRSRLEELARTYHVQWPVPVADEVPSATIGADATLSEVAPAGSEVGSSADAIVDEDAPDHGDAQDAGVLATAPADSTSGNVVDQDRSGTGETNRHRAGVVDTAQAEVARAEVAQAEVARAEVARAEVAQAEVAQAEVAQAEVAQVEVAQAEVAQAEVAQAEVAQVEVAQVEARIDSAEPETADVPAEAAENDATSTSEVAEFDAGDIPVIGDSEQRENPKSASRGAGRKTRRQRKKERLKEKASRAALERITKSADSTPLANVEPQGAHAIAGDVLASAASGEFPQSAERTELSTPILKVAAVQHEDVVLERMPVVDPNPERTPERAPERAIDPQSPDFVVDFDVAPAAAADGGIPAGRKSGVFLAVASFVAVVGILVGLAWMRYQEDRARTSTVKAPPAVQLPASDPVAAPAPTSAVPLEPMVASPPLVGVDPPAPASTGPVAPDPQTESRIAELLARADIHLQALHLTTPVGENAFEDFNAVLQLQPENEAAKRGIAAISARYVELADGAMSRGEFVAARRYLELAEMVDPGNTSVAGRREQLQNRRQASSAARDSEVVAEASVADGGDTRDNGVVDRVRDFLQPAPGAPAPASRADEIRERLGGQ